MNNDTFDYRKDSAIYMALFVLFSNTIQLWDGKMNAKVHMCCFDGKIQQNEIGAPPQPLNSLLDGSDHKQSVFEIFLGARTSFRWHHSKANGWFNTPLCQHLKCDKFTTLQVIFFRIDLMTINFCRFVLLLILKFNVMGNINSRAPLDSSIVRSLQNMLHSHNNLKTANGKCSAWCPKL